jgi:hypothetical protein
MARGRGLVRELEVSVDTIGRMRKRGIGETILVPRRYSYLFPNSFLGFPSSPFAHGKTSVNLILRTLPGSN